MDHRPRGEPDALRSKPESIKPADECCQPQDSPLSAGYSAGKASIFWNSPWPGTGNINADPLFVDPDNLAYGLAPGSPCIDAGSPASPLDEDGTIADMGALPFGRWLHLWNGLYGSHGIPLLEGAGDLTPGSETTLSLSHAREGSNAALVIGFSGVSAPLKGGVLVPAPDVIIFGASVDAGGTLSFAAPWPPGFPSGITTYFQWWINDPTGVSGFAASNALSGTTP